MTAQIAQLVAWLSPKVIERVDGGWTSETYSVDDAWIVQVARTSYAANTLRHQLRTLPRLAAHLGERIPHPQRLCDGPVTIAYKRLPGIRCDQAPDGAWPEQLGGLLSRLHSIKPASVGLESVPADTLREDSRADGKQLLALVLPRIPDADRPRAERFVGEYLDDVKMWRFLPAVIHRDLGPEHVLVSPAGDLVGVIDWEECSTGDPAWDFGWWLAEWPSIGNRILEAYGGAPDNEFRLRARHAWALTPWDEVRHGVDVGDESVIAAGIEGVLARLG